MLILAPGYFRTLRGDSQHWRSSSLVSLGTKMELFEITPMDATADALFFNKDENRLDPSKKENKFFYLLKCQGPEVLLHVS